MHGCDDAWSMCMERVLKCLKVSSCAQWTGFVGYIRREGFISEKDLCSIVMIWISVLWLCFKRLHMSMNASFTLLSYRLMSKGMASALNVIHDPYCFSIPMIFMLTFLSIILVGSCGLYFLASFQVKVRLKKSASQVKLELWGRYAYRSQPKGPWGVFMRCVILCYIMFMFQFIP